MNHRIHSGRVFTPRNTKRFRMLRKMENMRADKARIKMERGAAGLLEREPKLVKWFPLELGVRDKVSGDVAWTDLKSVRDTARRIGVVLRHYVP